MIELIVVILVMGIIGSLTVRLITSTMTTYETVMLRSQLVNHGRLFTSRFYRELKPLPRADSLLVADSQSIQWKTDHGKIYTYSITGSQINRQVNSAPAQLLVGDVSNANSAFSYYDSTGTALTSLPLNASNRLKVRLIGAEIKFTSGDESFTVHQEIHLPNTHRTR